MDGTEFTDRSINGPNEHRLVTVSREPIGEFDPKVQVPFHNHHARSFTVLPVRHRQTSFHFCLSLMPTHGLRSGTL
jgi:hypothetical protein